MSCTYWITGYRRSVSACVSHLLISRELDSLEFCEWRIFSIFSTERTTWISLKTHTWWTGWFHHIQFHYRGELYLFDHNNDADSKVSDANVPQCISHSSEVSAKRDKIMTSESNKDQTFLFCRSDCLDSWLSMASITSLTQERRLCMMKQTDPWKLCDEAD